MTKGIGKYKKLFTQYKLTHIEGTHNVYLIHIDLFPL